AATGRLLRILPRFQAPVQSIAFSPDGRRMATGQYGQLHPVQIWDLATLQATTLPDDDLNGNGWSLAFSPDGKFFAACGLGLTIWRLPGDEKVAGDAPRLSFKRVAHLHGLDSDNLCISPNS